MTNYRMLEPDERIEDGDEWQCTSGEWKKSRRLGHRQYGIPYRRPLPEEADQPAEPEKQPQSGEWWEAVIDGETVILWLFEIPGSGLRWVDFSDAVDAVDCGHVEFVRHLPDCSGFDYEIPPEQSPAKWFRVTDDEREGWCQSVGTHFNVVWDDGDCTLSIVDLSYKGIRKADAPNEYSGPIVAHKRERKGGAE